MKQLLRALGNALAFVIGIPLLLLFGIGCLLYAPIEWIRYRRMPYYRDFNIPYELFITSGDVVRIYNRIVREHLPITYVRNEDYEYFIKGDNVLLCGWSHTAFDQIDGEWYFVFDGEEAEPLSVREMLECDRESVLPEHRRFPAYYLLFYGDVTDADIFEKAKTCPYFYCVFSDEEV